MPSHDRPETGVRVLAKPDPKVWAAALRLADGDARRLVLEEDGSVSVVNQPGTRPVRRSQ
jgi:hypothetical protein